MLVLALVSALVSQVPDEVQPHPVPAYLPRNVAAGVMVSSQAISLDVRLGWALGVLEQPRNHLLLVANVGTAATLATPPGIRSIYQHTATIGLGYQMPLRRFFWGFQIGFGPLWYRAGYAPGLPYFFENRWLPYTEGRIEAGVRVSGALKIGAAFGMSSPVSFNQRFPANTYLGGVMFSLLVDWR